MFEIPPTPNASGRACLCWFVVLEKSKSLSRAVSSSKLRKGSTMSLKSVTMLSRLCDASFGTRRAGSEGSESMGMVSDKVRSVYFCVMWIVAGL